jgi:hypothetical protein
MKKVVKRGGLVNDLRQRNFFNEQYDLDYVLHAHGTGDNENYFQIPDNTYIYVYSPLGSELCLRTSNNDVCARNGTYHRVYGPGDEFPALYFYGDVNRQWRSGIKRCHDNAIVVNIEMNTEARPFNLQLGLPRLHRDKMQYLDLPKRQGCVHLHIMACTQNIPRNFVDRSANRSIMTDAFAPSGRKINSALRPPNGLIDVYNMIKTHSELYKEVKPKVDALIANNPDSEYTTLRDVILNEFNRDAQQHMERLVGLSVIMHKTSRPKQPIYEDLDTFKKIAEKIYGLIFRDFESRYDGTWTQM